MSCEGCGAVTYTALVAVASMPRLWLPHSLPSAVGRAKLLDRWLCYTLESVGCRPSPPGIQGYLPVLCPGVPRRRRVEYPAHGRRVRVTMKVEIWSDVVCPWCYIGKRRFESALAEFPHRDEVEVTYRSFELDPTAQVESGQSVTERLAEKYGVSEAQAAA